MTVAGSRYTAVSSHQQASIAAPVAASINQKSTNESPRIRCNRFNMGALPLAVNVDQGAPSQQARLEAVLPDLTWPVRLIIAALWPMHYITR
jgi:hypothetical protein